MLNTVSLCASTNCRAMVFDRPLADPEISCNVLAWMAGEHEGHNLGLSRGQTFEVVQGRFARVGNLF